MNAESPKRSALVIFAIGIVLIHLALNIAHGLAHGGSGSGSISLKIFLWWW